MNFVFCTLMFCILEYSAFKTYEVFDHKYKDLPKITGLKTKNAAQPTANLKLNVFDKMLSEEMLSIKQHFHERDSSHTPSVRITVQGIGATPTLEVKQKWPIENLFLKSWNRSKVLMNDEVNQVALNLTTNETTMQTNEDRSSKNGSKWEIKDKVVELRSLPETKVMRICDCMKTNPEPTCSHRCTGMDASRITNICIHTTKEIKHECTRTAESISSFLTYSLYPIYVTHPSYFWGITTYTENPYYHPSPINEIKLSKTKKRRKFKKPRPTIEGTYEGEFQDNNERYDNSMENYINSIEAYDEDIDNFSKLKSSVTNNKATIEYQEDKFKEQSRNELDFVDKDLFVNDIIDDLKEHYSDIVIKDCYCSLSPRNYILNLFLLQFFVSAYSFLYF